MFFGSKSPKANVICQPFFIPCDPLFQPLSFDSSGIHLSTGYASFVPFSSSDLDPSSFHQISSPAQLHLPVVTDSLPVSSLPINYAPVHVVGPPHTSSANPLSSCIYIPSAHDSTLVPLSSVVSSEPIPSSPSIPLHITPSANAHPMLTRSKASQSVPIPTSFSTPHPLLTRSKVAQSSLQALTTISVSSDDMVYREPTSIYEDLQSHYWTEVVQEELSALSVNQTW